MTAIDPDTGPGFFQNRAKRMLLVKVTLVLILTPVMFFVGPLFMTTSKTLFLILTPVLLVALLSGKLGRLVAADILMLCYIFWIAVSIGLNNPEAFVTFVGSQATLFLGGYLVGRACIRTGQDFFEFSKFMALCVVVLLPFAIYETVTRTALIPYIIDKIPGIITQKEAHHGQRLGLNRAQVVFIHPIHWGLFAAMAFGLVLTGLRSVYGLSTRLVWAGMVGFACFTSVSSGPFLALLAQLALLIYWRLLRDFEYLWTALLSCLAVGYVVLEVFSTRPAFFAIAERLAFNSYTAHLRKVLIDHGMIQIAKTPVFGIGYNSWDLPEWMSGSVDNYWLMNALVYGVPAFVILFTMFIWGMVAASRRKFEKGTLLHDQRRAWVSTVTSLTLIMATVAIWGEIASVIFLFMGAGAFFLLVPDHGTATDPGATPVDTGPREPRRFARDLPLGPLTRPGALARSAAAGASASQTRLTEIAQTGLRRGSGAPQYTRFQTTPPTQGLTGNDRDQRYRRTPTQSEGPKR